MDPISIIVAALVAGASSAAKETASSVVKDAYQVLKNLIKSKLADDAVVPVAIDGHEEDPVTWDKPLRKSLSKGDAEHDTEIIAAAQALLKKTDPDGVASGKYHISVSGNVKGLVQGDNATVAMNFNDPKQD